MDKISQIIQSARAYSCLDCGRCTVACPVSRYDPSFSPRKLVHSATWRSAEALKDRQLWSCLTCSMCEERCQAGVRYTALVRSLREEAYLLGNRGECTHGGALDSFMRIMESDRLKQDRLGWVDKRLKVAARSEIVYFVGCLPYFDIIFSDIGVKTLGIARGAIKLLNSLGIAPTLMGNERCCGHDRLWQGDTAGFTRLAEQNLEEIHSAGAQTVLTTCPECYHTLKFEYPRRFGSLKFDVLHISQFLAPRLEKLKFRRLAKRVAYHDPCRLGRLSGVYDEPRRIIGAIPGLELAEMERSRSSALCCGTQAWIGCGALNKQIQTELLREAAATGASVLLTSCPKCQIHLRCAMKGGQGLAIEVEDVVSLAARTLASREASNEQ